MSEDIKCRKIAKGNVTGPAIVTQDPISFLGGVDPNTGIVIDPKHELYNESIVGKILIIPSGKGSTVGSYVIYQMAKNNTAPKAIICLKAEPIIATGAIISKIPMVDEPELNIINTINTGDTITVNANESVITIK